MILSQVGVTLVTSVTSIVLARSLTKQAFGEFSGFLGLSQALSLAIDVGMATWLLRELSSFSATKTPDEAVRAGSGLIISVLSANVWLGGALAAGTAGASLAVGVRPDLAFLGFSLIAYMTFVAMAIGLEADLRARRTLRRVVAANIVEKITLLSLIVGSFVFGIGLWGVGVGYLIAGVLRIITNYSAVLGGRLSQSWQERTSTVHVLRRSAPFGVNAAAQAFLPRLDVPMLAAISATSAASYALGWQIVTTLILIPIVAGSTLYPILARYSEAMSLQWIALGFGVVGAAVASVAGALTPVVLPAVFGAKYSHAVHVVEIMLLSVPVTFYFNGLLVLAYSHRRENELGRRTVPAAALGSIAVLAGQLALGPSGAAAGFVLRSVLFVAAILPRSQGAAGSPLREAR